MESIEAHFVHAGLERAGRTGGSAETSTYIMAADRYRALIVDDHAPTRTLFARKFERRGWETCTADTIAEALERLDPVPDCLVLDLNLPDGRSDVRNR